MLKNPKQEPPLDTLQLTPPDAKVARVNRSLFITLLSALGVMVAVSLVYGLQPLKGKKDAAKVVEAVPAPLAMPDSFADLPGSYAELKAHEKENINGANRTSTLQGTSSLAGLSPALRGQVDPTRKQQEQEAKAQAQRDKQEEAQALHSKLTVSLSHTVANSQPTSLATNLKATPSPSLPGKDATMDPGAVQNMQGDKRDFIKNTGDSTIYLSHTLQPPVSEYQVNAGTLIPALLITGINSDLPGQIIAQVRENVYDTVTGNILLIPQGARLIGQYDSLISYGQNRILLIWDKLVMPDGYTITLDSMAGTDLAGYAGLKDGVDYHTLRLAGSVLISSLLSVGVTQTQAGRTGVSQQFSQNVAEDINKAGQEIVHKNLNVQPTLTIRPGYSLNVFVNKHMVLKPYIN